jgi:NAD(P)-dependent dehydrogenase (short-subunit alcohol dehydrogenase family)
LEATVVGSFSRIGYVARRALFDWADEPRRARSGGVALITGATAGIGLAAAQLLAAGGMDLWIVGRDRGRADAAKAAILASAPAADVKVAVADLAELDDVRRLADVVRTRTDRLDVLIHNAGALTHELQRTVDGLELTAQVHVVAPFLLTEELLPLLRSTQGARVVTVSSGGMYTQRLEVAALADPPEPFNGVRAYANAKRAQVVLNHRWAAEPSARGVSFYAMHPGWVDTAGLRAGLPRFHAVMRPLLRTPQEGADTIAWLATSPSVGPRQSGTFWLDRRPRWTTPLPWTVTTASAVEELWRWCREQSGVRDALRTT